MHPRGYRGRKREVDSIHRGNAPWGGQGAGTRLVLVTEATHLRLTRPLLFSAEVRLCRTHKHTPPTNKHQNTPTYILTYIHSQVRLHTHMNTYYLIIKINF